MWETVSVYFSATNVVRQGGILSVWLFYVGPDTLVITIVSVYDANADDHDIILCETISMHVDPISEIRHW